MAKEKFTKTHQKILSIISVIIFIALVMVIGWYIGIPLVKLAEKPDVFRDWIDAKGIFGQFIFVGIIVVQMIFAIIPGEPFEIGAGYAFGAIEGTILCLIGSMLGSLIIFAIVRTLGIRFVETFFSMNKINNLKLLNDKNKFNVLMFLVFFIPGTPKDLLVYFLGLTKISVPAFLLVTTVAKIPSIITSTVGGNALGEKQYIIAIIVFALTLVISAVGYFIYLKVTSNKNKSSK